MFLALSVMVLSLAVSADPGEDLLRGPPAVRAARVRLLPRRSGPARVSSLVEPAAEARVAARAAAPSREEEAAEVAADRARDAAAAAEPRVTERAIDRAGRILERRLGPALEVQSVRVVGTIDELPVLSAERGEGGEIIERVRDRAVLLEVRRDPVGRFLSARALPPQDGEE